MAILSGTGFTFNVRSLESWTDNSGGTAQETVTFAGSASITDGTDDGEADRTLSRSSTSLSGSTTLTLSSFTSARASGLAMARVNLLWFRNKGTVNLEFGPNTTNGWDVVIAATETVEPGGVIFLYNPNAGHAVTASSKDQIKINCPSGTGAYELLVIGQSA